MMTVRINTSDINGAIKSITKKWDAYVPNQAIRYSFLHTEFAKMYDNVERTGKIFRDFAFLAIIVALLGLYGLAEFITKERTKEIGVRKINGADKTDILASLSKSFVTGIIISLVIAVPLSYYAMEKWLENFAYKTDLSWWIFVSAGAAAVAIALITVSWQSFRAAMRNPVEALRYE